MLPLQGTPGASFKFSYPTNLTISHIWNRTESWLSGVVQDSNPFKFMCTPCWSESCVRCAGGAGKRFYLDAIHMLLLEKRYSVDSVRTPPSYDIPWSQAFWNVRVRIPESIRLTNRKVLELYRAHMYLRDLWLIFLLHPPAEKSWVTEENGRRLLCCSGTSADKGLHN